MTLAVDITDRHGLSNEISYCQGNAVLILHSKRNLTSCTLLTRWSTLVFKVGCAVWVVIKLAYSVTVRI